MEIYKIMQRFGVELNINKCLNMQNLNYLKEKFISIGRGFINTILFISYCIMPLIHRKYSYNIDRFLQFLHATTTNTQQKIRKIQKFIHIYIIYRDSSANKNMIYISNEFIYKLRPKDGISEINCSKFHGQNFSLRQQTCLIF